MKKLRLFLPLVLLFIAANVFAQGDPLDYLRKQCPQLTEKYRTELENCHAHYIMAVDVSLSMCRYQEQVLPAVKAFIKALPDGDKVTLIPFATEAYDNLLGFDVEVNRQTRASLLQVMDRLYPNTRTMTPAERQPYMDTDIFDAQQAVARSIQQNAQYEVNIVIFITDMMHCPSKNIDRQFTDSEIQQMESLLKSATSARHECRAFALELPQAGNPNGYVLPTLKKLYNEDWNVDLIQVLVPQNSEALIGQWFDKQKDLIMFTKLQAIIIKENNANPIVAETHVDIDGNVTGKIKWTAGKLYPKITIDSTYVAENSDFVFKCNKEFVKYSAVGELDVPDMKLGKLKSKTPFFHKLADTLYFDVSLPVPYQDEIDKLLEGRPGPVAASTEYKERLVWTFFLPLWLSALLLLLLIIYLLLVIRTAMRNAALSFRGKVDVKTIDDDEIFNGKSVSNVKRFTIGAGGSNGLAFGAPWGLTVKKKSPSPFTLKPAYFEWSKSSGYVSAKVGKYQKITGVLNDNNTVAKIDAGPAKGNITHKITIKYFK